jgi:hypothetical protein
VAQFSVVAYVVHSKQFDGRCSDSKSLSVLETHFHKADADSRQEHGHGVDQRVAVGATARHVETLSLFDMCISSDCGYDCFTSKSYQY